MHFFFTKRADRDFDALSPTLQVLMAKQIDFLVEDIRHPSLHAKKFDASQDVWQGRVDRNYRFYFTIAEDVYVILSITKHPK